MILAGIATLGFLVLMFKLGLRKVLGYDIYVDIALTVLLMMMLSGSFDGVMVALVSGLLISIILLILRKFIGYERYEDYAFDDGKVKTIWVRYPGWIA